MGFATDEHSAEGGNTVFYSNIIVHSQTNVEEDPTVQNPHALSPTVKLRCRS